MSNHIQHQVIQKEEVELRGCIHKIINFSFGESDDSITMYKIKQNIYLLKKNQLMQEEQIKEQYEFWIWQEYELLKIETCLKS